MFPLSTWQVSCSSFSPATDRKLKTTQLAEKCKNVRTDLYFNLGSYRFDVTSSLIKTADPRA